MTLRGFDAMGVLDGPQVRQARGDFAIRYVGIPTNPKCIRPPELGSLLGAGVAVGFVYESWAGRAVEGYDAGRADALATQNYMWHVLGIPEYPTVFYAADADVSFSQVKAYFQGVNSVWKCGGYGSEQVISGLLDNNLITEVWQTVAWSHGVVDQRASVYQTGEQVVLPNGTTCDVNTARELGSWAYGGDVAISGDDALKIVQAIFQYPFQVLGQDEHGNDFPSGRNTDLQAIVQWFDSDILGVQRAMLPVLNEILAELKTLNAKPAASVVLDETQAMDLRNAAEDAVATSVHDALQAAASSFLPKTGA